MTEDPRPDSPARLPVVALVATPGAGGMAVAAALGAVGVPVLAPERRERSERREPGTQPVTSYTESLLNACQAIWWAPPEYRP
ncbi:MAG TPA: hypothetical protein VGL48_13095, partial [Acidimicrobiales bacterium]